MLAEPALQLPLTAGRCATKAEAYLRTVPCAPYRAVGISLKLYIDSSEVVREWNSDLLVCRALAEKFSLQAFHNLP